MDQSGPGEGGRAAGGDEEPTNAKCVEKVMVFFPLSALYAGASPRACYRCHLAYLPVTEDECRPHSIEIAIELQRRIYRNVSFLQQFNSVR